MQPKVKDLAYTGHQKSNFFIEKKMLMNEFMAIPDEEVPNVLWIQ